MSQFYASIQGSRGEATRQGSKNSGIVGHVRGWNLGCRVEMSHEDGRDVCRVYRTGGSNGGGEVFVAKFSE
jgi:hypothetical protein